MRHAKDGQPEGQHLQQAGGTEGREQHNVRHKSHRGGQDLPAAGVASRPRATHAGSTYS